MSKQALNIGTKQPRGCFLITWLTEILRQVLRSAFGSVGTQHLLFLVGFFSFLLIITQPPKTHNVLHRFLYILEAPSVISHPNTQRWATMATQITDTCLWVRGMMVGVIVFVAPSLDWMLRDPSLQIKPLWGSGSLGSRWIWRGQRRTPP